MHHLRQGVPSHREAKEGVVRRHRRVVAEHEQPRQRLHHRRRLAPAKDRHHRRHQPRRPGQRRRRLGRRGRAALLRGRLVGRRDVARLRLGVGRLAHDHFERAQPALRRLGAKRRATGRDGRAERAQRTPPHRTARRNAEVEERARREVAAQRELLRGAEEEPGEQPRHQQQLALGRAADGVNLPQEGLLALEHARPDLFGRARLVHRRGEGAALAQADERRDRIGPQRPLRRLLERGLDQPHQRLSQAAHRAHERGGRGRRLGRRARARARALVSSHRRGIAVGLQGGEDAGNIGAA